MTGPDLARIQGCLLGFCLGDSLGQTTRNMPHSVAREFADEWITPWLGGKKLEHAPAELQISDGAQLGCELLRSIDDRGHFRLAEFIARLKQMFANGRICSRYLETHRAVSRLKRDSSLLTADSQSLASGSVHRSPAVGLAYWPDAARLRGVSRRFSLITHANEVCLAAGETIAALVADVLLGKVGSEDSPFALQVMSQQERFRETVDWLIRVLPLASDELPRQLHEFLSNDVGAEFDGLPDDVRATFVVSIYHTVRSRWDFARAITGIIALGGEVTAAASIAGALCGARGGRDALPPSLVTRVTDRRVVGYHDLLALAERIHRISAQTS